MLINKSINTVALLSINYFILPGQYIATTSQRISS